LGQTRSRGGLGLATAIALVLLQSCYDSHVIPIVGERVRVEQTQLNAASGLHEPMPPVDASVVAWSCDGSWSAEADVDDGGYAVFQPPEGLDCWNLTAVDLHFSVGGGASTVLRAPIPFEGAIMLPAGFCDLASATPDTIEVGGRVVGLPEGTEAVDVTSDVRMVHVSTEIVGSEARFARRVDRMPPGEPLHLTVLAMRDGFPVHGVEADFAMPESGRLTVELALPEASARIERAELAMHVPDEVGLPWEGPTAWEGSVYLQGRLGGRVGHARLERSSGIEWTGEARWVAFTEGAAILSPTFAWSTELASGYAFTTLRARGSAEALSVMTIPEIADQRVTFDAPPGASRSRLHVSVGHGDLVPQLQLRRGLFPTYRTWWMGGFGPGKMELEDWPRLPSDLAPEDIVGTEGPPRVLVFIVLHTPHEAGPDDPASFRITAPESFGGVGAGVGM
jgi:hypothetical protein